MRRTALVMAGLAALALSAAPASAQTRVVAKKPAMAPIKTTLGQAKPGVAGMAKPSTGNQIKIAPNAGAGLVAAGGGNFKGNGLVAAGGGNFKPR
jgi:hypothetical protein